MQIVPFSIEIASRLKNLFQDLPPIPIRLWAILDGAIQGCILVDDPSHPRFAILQDLAEGPAYLGGAVTAQDLLGAFRLLRSYQELVICLWSDSPLIALLPPGPTYEGIAIDFTDRSPAVDIDRLALIPPGYRIERIGPELAQKVEGFDYYVRMFGSLEQALQNMIGYCLVQGETVVSEAVAAPLTRGIAEMGVETVENYRKKGLATVISAYVIRECEALGYHVFWNAAQQNLASVALARRLGFQTEQSFTVLAWSATNEPDPAPTIPETNPGGLPAPPF
jgi:hypothetical protein